MTADPNDASETANREPLCFTQTTIGGHITARRAPTDSGLRVACNNDGEWEYAGVYCSYVGSLSKDQATTVETLGRRWTISRFPFQHHQDIWEAAFQSLQFSVYDLSRAAPVEMGNYHVGRVENPHPMNPQYSEFDPQGSVLVWIDGIVEEAQRVAAKIRNLARTAALYRWENSADPMMEVPAEAASLIEGVTAVLSDVGAMSEPLQAQFDEAREEVNSFATEDWRDQWLRFENSVFFYKSDGLTIATINSEMDRVKEAFADAYSIDISTIDITDVREEEEYPTAIIVDMVTIIRVSEEAYYQQLIDPSLSPNTFNNVAIDLKDTFGFDWPETPLDDVDRVEGFSPEQQQLAHDQRDIANHQETQGMAFVSQFENRDVFQTLEEHYIANRVTSPGTPFNWMTGIAVCLILLLLVIAIVLCCTGMAQTDLGRQEEETPMGYIQKPTRGFTEDGGVTEDIESAGVDEIPPEAGNFKPGNKVVILSGAKKGRRGKLLRWERNGTWQVQISRKERGRVRPENLQLDTRHRGTSGAGRYRSTSGGISRGESDYSGRAGGARIIPILHEREQSLPSLGDAIMGDN